jgi:hypothetical protein
MTRTVPLRRTILQFSQIRLTLARTFMVSGLRRLGSWLYQQIARLKPNEPDGMGL